MNIEKLIKVVKLTKHTSVEDSVKDASKQEVERAINNLGYKVKRWTEYEGDVSAHVDPRDVDNDGYDYFNKQVKKLKQYGKDVYADGNEIVFHQAKFSIKDAVKAKDYEKNMEYERDFNAHMQRHKKKTEEQKKNIIREINTKYPQVKIQEQSTDEERDLPQNKVSVNVGTRLIFSNYPTDSTWYDFLIATYMKYCKEPNYLAKVYTSPKDMYLFYTTTFDKDVYRGIDEYTQREKSYLRNDSLSFGNSVKDEVSNTDISNAVQKIINSDESKNVLTIGGKKIEFSKNKNKKIITLKIDGEMTVFSDKDDKLQSNIESEIRKAIQNSNQITFNTK